MGSTAINDGRYTVGAYFALLADGQLDPDERGELLDGVIVARAPQNPALAAGIRRVERALRESLGPDIVISSQLPFISGPTSVPQPDVAVLRGQLEDYELEHPTAASLIVEIADTSLAQDRLPTSRIYAHAGIPQYWIVNLRDQRVECFADPDREARVYRKRLAVSDATPLIILDYPRAAIRAEDLLPPARPLDDD